MFCTVTVNSTCWHVLKDLDWTWCGRHAIADSLRRTLPSPKSELCRRCQTLWHGEEPA